MIGRILNGAAAVAGAGALAQFPEFFQQYLQRLGGRLDQAQLDLDRILRDATTLGRTLEVYLEELLTSGTTAARQAARRELERVDQTSDLQNAYDALTLAEPAERPFLFIKHFDADVAEETLSIFAPALPTTGEGLAYAAAGMLIALGLMAGGEAGVRGARRRLHRRRKRIEAKEAEPS